jgi:hypothetical protein
MPMTMPERHGADRQVDAAGDDDRGHAERDDSDEGEVAGDVEQVLLRREDVAGQGQKDEGQHGGEGHPERLAADEPAQQRAARLLAGRIRESHRPVWRLRASTAEAPIRRTRSRR